MYLLRNLLWVDCIAGALAGALMFALRERLSGMYGLPRDLLLLMAAANLLYACFSFSLAIRTARPLYLIIALAGANMAWAAVCLTLAMTFRESASTIGIVALAAEAVFVGALAYLEWRQRHPLSTGRRG